MTNPDIESAKQREELALERCRRSETSLVDYLLSVGAEGVRAADPAVDAALTKMLAELNASYEALGVEVALTDALL